MPETSGPGGMRILVIDDDPALLRSLDTFLTDRGHRTFLAEDGVKGLEILRRESIDIAITDMVLPTLDGFEVLEQTRTISPGTEVIMITAHGDVETAVRAMRQGAFDFFSKPLRVEDLQAALQRTERFQALRRKADRYRRNLDQLATAARQRHGLSSIIGQSRAIRAVRELVEQVCQTGDTTVLVCGETGTGKELVARAVHTEGARALGPFVAVNCSAVPATLVESQLFGHVRGAFTGAGGAHKGFFELASGGTLFLDEIGDMDWAMQAKLLRTLEGTCVRPVGGSSEIPVDVRVVSATNRDLPQAIAQGKFRQELFYRLNVFTIRIPPLRERKEDIVPIAEHYMREFSRELRKPIKGISPEATARLESHHFPGNVRELKNLIERAVIVCKGDRITRGDLEFQEAITPGGFNPAELTHLSLDAIERAVIEEALRRSGENQTRAARLLGITRRQLFTRLRNHGL